VIGEELAMEIVRAFVSATFSGEERYVRRLAKIGQMEDGIEPAAPRVGLRTEKLTADS